MTPRTLAGMLRQRAGSALQDRLAICFQEGGAWTEHTWGEFWGMARGCAAGLAAAGVRPGDIVLSRSCQRENGFQVYPLQSGLRSVRPAPPSRKCLKIPSGFACLRFRRGRCNCLSRTGRWDVMVPGLQMLGATSTVTDLSGMV
jgi:acyl-CoA synthetase (AMP-forming)/AMP-acid ligase II